MTLSRALGYFWREAARNLARSWRASLVAVLTIGTSLAVAGAFLLLTGNLARAAAGWRSELTATVFLRDDATPEQQERVLELARAPAWARAAEMVSADTAAERFGATFSSLADVVAATTDNPFLASVEVTLDPDALEGGALAGWAARLESEPGVEFVDSDQQWLERLVEVVAFARLVGLVVGLGLVVAATFTIAFVIRLTAYLHLEEIAVMRLVGATEFYIRGPFYVEGLLQGLLGGLLALSALFSLHALALSRAADSAWLSLALGSFLPWREQVLLLLLGGFAGLFGAVASLRRESLRPAGSD
ncbi:MAG TPA: permease-like cell division protein FtsX [Thermoanaerobaculia bacterium]|nr:permease-like cell division protein FtsX [Thermoanaerobaculia bacterium]